LVGELLARANGDKFARMVLVARKGVRGRT
jgi:hypothetical protein